LHCAIGPKERFALCMSVPDAGAQKGFSDE
jgi:hypothetical protein